MQEIKEYLLHQLNDAFSDNFQTLPKKILIALSGGIDSLALVLIAKEWCNNHNITLKTATIDHQLRNNSSIEAKELHNLMNSKNIDHQILVWHRTEQLSSNIEAQARKARYKLLTDYAIKENISIIVTAHHLDDQIETFFIRLLRGSGIDGLASMKTKNILSNNITIFRPFLNISKKQLKIFLESNQQNWFEDETNNNTEFLRNKIRSMLYNIEDKEIIDKRIIQTITHFDRAKDFLQKHTEEIFTKLVKTQDKKLVMNIADFKNLHKEIALRLLIRIFKEINGKYDKPRFKNLSILYDKITNDQINKSTSFAGSLIIIKKEIISFVPEYDN